MTQINELWADKLEVRIWHDEDGYYVDVINNDLPDDADTLVAGYEVETEEQAESLARAWVDGYKIAKGKHNA